MNMNNHTTALSGRLMSVDALRGFTMFWIIGGDAPILIGLAKGTGSEFLNRLLVQFEHVHWEGFRCWDLVMPLFLFVVGVVMPFSFNRRLERGQSKRQVYFHIIKRVLILWVLGMVAQGNLLEYDLSRLQIYSNTLQSIAAGYLIASILILHLNIKWQMVTTAGLLLLFWALMAWVPVPGHSAGVLTEEGNLAIYIDNLILGRFSDGYTYTWVLSSITFGGTVMLGVMGGTCCVWKKVGQPRSSGLQRRGLAAWRWAGYGGWFSRLLNIFGRVQWCFSQAAGAFCCWLCFTCLLTCGVCGSGRLVLW